MGYFNQAQKLKELPVTSIVQSFQSVTYPALANIKDNAVKFADSYLRVLLITAAVVAPIMVGMIAVADDMFLLLLGERWMPTVPYFKILSLSGLFYPLSMIAYNVLKVAGDGAVIIRLEIVKKAIMTVILAITIPHSAIAVAWGLVAMAGVEFLLNTAASLRFARLKVRDILATLCPVLLLTAAMYCAVTLATPHISSLNLLLRFVIEVGIGVVVYTVGAVAFRMRFIAEIRETVLRMFRR